MKWWKVQNVWVKAWPPAQVKFFVIIPGLRALKSNTEHLDCLAGFVQLQFTSAFKLYAISLSQFWNVNHQPALNMSARFLFAVRLVSWAFQLPMLAVLSTDSINCLNFSGIVSFGVICGFHWNILIFLEKVKLCSTIWPNRHLRCEILLVHMYSESPICAT